MAKPEIRLKGFKGEWELSSFSNLGLLRRGLTYTPSNIDISGVRVLRSSNINEDTFVLSKDDVFVREDCVNIALVNDGDILITAANGSPRLVGKHCVIRINKDEKMAHGGFMLLASSNEPYFLNYSMSSSWYRDFQRIGIAGGNGAIGNLNKNELEKFPFFIPKDGNERKGIADYFKSLDSMIQGVTKKIASIKQMKQACLVSMFPQAGETTPRVRFKGFKGEWVIVKLSSIAKRITRKNSQLESTLPLTISAAEGLIEQTAFFNNVVASSNVSGYYLLKKGEFAYNKSYSNGYPFGAVKRLDKYHGLLNIGAEDFLDIDIFLPKDISEQQQIASFFTSLDKQISLQEARLEKLKQIKSACLDKMFV